MKLPFSLDRTVNMSLGEQMFQGLRKAIIKGDYKPGQTLPGIHELAEENVVCVRYFHCAEGDVYMEVAFGEDDTSRVMALSALETVRNGLEYIEAHYPEYLLLE